MVAHDYLSWAADPKPRVPLGFNIIDSRTNGGIAKGEMLMFLARTGVGKTIWAVNVVNNNPERAILFVSLEMHGRFILQRLAAVHSDVASSTIESEVRANARSEHISRVVRDFPHLSIVDNPDLTFDEMVRVVDEVSAVNGKRPEMVIVDFLELVNGINSTESVGQVDKAAKLAKVFARKTDTALVVLHQVSRGAGAGGGDRLTSESGRYGGEVSADYIMGAWRPHMNKDTNPKDREDLRTQFGLQFMKTRGGHELKEDGELIHINPASMRLTDPKAEQRGLWGDEDYLGLGIT